MPTRAPLRKPKGHRHGHQLKTTPRQRAPTRAPQSTNQSGTQSHGNDGSYKEGKEPDGVGREARHLVVVPQCRGLPDLHVEPNIANTLRTEFVTLHLLLTSSSTHHRAAATAITYTHTHTHEQPTTIRNAHTQARTTNYQDIHARTRTHTHQERVSGMHGHMVEGPLRHVQVSRHGVVGVQHLQPKKMRATAQPPL